MYKIKERRIKVAKLFKIECTCGKNTCTKIGIGATLTEVENQFLHEAGVICSEVGIGKVTEITYEEAYGELKKSIRTKERGLVC